MTTSPAAPPPPPPSAATSSTIINLIIRIARASQAAVPVRLSIPVADGLPQLDKIRQAWSRISPSSSAAAADLDAIAIPDSSSNLIADKCSSLVDMALSFLEHDSSNADDLFQLSYRFALHIYAFELAVRRARFQAPRILRSVLLEEANQILITIISACQKLARGKKMEAVDMMVRLRRSLSPSLTTKSLATNAIRKNLSSMQKHVDTILNNENSVPRQIQRRRKQLVALEKLLDLSLQTLGFLSRFVSRDYKEDEESFGDIFLSNAAIISGDLVKASEELMHAAEGGHEHFLGALGRFCFASKALKDIMVGEEQFGDEPLRGGAATGRQVLYTFMKRMQAAQKEINE